MNQVTLIDENRGDGCMSWKKSLTVGILALVLGLVAAVKWNPKGVQVGDYIPTSHPKLKGALAKGKPIVLTFSTVWHCNDCARQMDNLEPIKKAVGDQVTFVHIQTYFGSEDDKRAVREFGVRGEPWTYLIDSNGKVLAILHGYANEHELERALKKHFHSILRVSEK